MFNFKNSYINLPENFYQRVTPEILGHPKLIRFNTELAKDLGAKEIPPNEELASIFSGQKILPGSEPASLAYAGMQFGHAVPVLGDGRAHYLGEVQGHDIQLKGSGRTPFSRRGDGKSALGPVLREYIVSEAMHALNIPTTRALCAIATGEQVIRQFGSESGGIFTRVASSHLRVGTIQYFAFQADQDSLQILLKYVFKRHYPELVSDQPINKNQVIEFLNQFIQKQAKLIAKWLSLGFIHGVMNTDNFSLAGITIDYGPCAFMDEFTSDKVFSSIDRNGRYNYSNQIQIAKWNILRLCDCLLPFIDSNQATAIQVIENEVMVNFSQFEEERDKLFSQKLGLTSSDTKSQKLIQNFLSYLENNQLDFTLAFRNLPDLLTNEDQTFYPPGQDLEDFLFEWQGFNPEISELDQINPIYIPRNHQIEKAIQQAYQQDYTLFHRLIDELKEPYVIRERARGLELPPAKTERVCQTFCGT